MGFLVKDLDELKGLRLETDESKDKNCCHFGIRLQRESS